MALHIDERLVDEDDSKSPGLISARCDASPSQANTIPPALCPLHEYAIASQQKPAPSSSVPAVKGDDQSFLA